jgi:hypothetical protein
MKRVTMYLSGVKPEMVTIKKLNQETGKYTYSEKKVLFNTISYICASEDEGNAYVAQYLADHKDVTLNKVTFCNVR